MKPCHARAHRCMAKVRNMASAMIPICCWYAVQPPVAGKVAPRRLYTSVDRTVPHTESAL
eukprot:37818-Eustigmatos_ZCMA.PRE.1